MNSDSENFNWVSARSECSIVKAFENLRLTVEADVEQRHKIIKPDPRFGTTYGFRFVSSGPKFSACLEGNNLHQCVAFSLTQDSIIISDENRKELFRAMVTINNDKRCVLLVAGEELEEWQLRKKALEQLFFCSVVGPS